MKKLLALACTTCLVVLLAPAAAMAQADGVGVQIIGGPLFSNIDDASGFNTEQKAGWLVGLGLGGNRGGIVGVEGDILFGKRGAKINVLDFDTNVVHVPIMLKVNL